MPDDVNFATDERQGDSVVTEQPAQAEASKVDWQAKYNGQYGYSLQLRKQLESALSVKAQLEQQLEALKMESSAQIESLTTQVKTFQTDAQKHAADAQTLRTDKDIWRMLQKDYPALMDVYGEDDALTVLRLMEPEARKAHLDRMYEKFGVAVTQTATEARAGTPPPKPNTPTPTGKVDVRSLMSDLESIGREKGTGSPEYYDALQRYQDALLRQQ